jgi:SAM-dependent methyltransferase
MVPRALELALDWWAPGDKDGPMTEGCAAQSDEQRLAALHEAITGLKDEARTADPNDFWLTTSELSTLGYEHLALEIDDTLLDAGFPEDASVLDWGAGPGHLTYLLEHLGLATTYLDFDYDYPAFKLALSRLKGEKRFIEDPVKLPFEDSSFDAVVSFGVLEHVPDPPGSVGEVMRVLRPGGIFFVYHFPNKYSYTEALAGLLGVPNHGYKLDRRGLLRLLDVPGSEIERADYRYLIPRNLTDMPRLRGFISHHANGFYSLDRGLTRIPGLRLFSTTHTVIVRKIV